MNAYRRWSECVYEIIEKSEPMYQIQYKRELTEEDMMNWVYETKHFVISEQRIPLIPIDIYEWLISKKKIKLTKEKRDEYLEFAIKIRHNQLVDYANDGDEKGKERLKEFSRMKKEGVFEGYESNCVRDLAKKVSVYFYFKNQQS